MPRRMKPGFYRPITRQEDAETVVRTSEAILRRIKRLKHGNQLTWEEIALSDDLFGVPAGSLSTMLKEWRVLDKWSERLGERKTKKRVRKQERPRVQLNRKLHDMTPREIMLALLYRKEVSTNE